MEQPTPTPNPPHPALSLSSQGLLASFRLVLALGFLVGGTQLPRVWPVSLHAALLIHTHKLLSGWGPQRLSLQNYQAGLCLGT